MTTAAAGSAATSELPAGDVVVGVVVLDVVVAIVVLHKERDRVLQPLSPKCKIKSDSERDLRRGANEKEREHQKNSVQQK